MLINKENENVQKIAKELGYCNFFSDNEKLSGIQDYVGLFNGGEKTSALTVFHMTTNHFLRVLAKIEDKNPGTLKSIGM